MNDPAYHDAVDAMRAVAAELGLPFEPSDQDWGIVNSDARRLEEFIQFFQDHDLHPAPRWELTELILASAEDRLAEEPDADLSVVSAWLAQHPDPETRRWHVEYWSRRNETALPDWLSDA
jgi:hypothetical protein